MKLVVAILSLALVASADSGSLSFQGGSVPSPDGKYRVWASPKGLHGKAMTSNAWLIEPGGKRRMLMAYERSAQVIWPHHANRVVLLERNIHFASYHAFPLTGTAPRDRIQGDIEREMAARRPRLGTVESRAITIGRGTCITVDESGLPPGRDTGSFIARSGAFRIDLATMRATLTPRC